MDARLSVSENGRAPVYMYLRLLPSRRLFFGQVASVVGVGLFLFQAAVEGTNVVKQGIAPNRAAAFYVLDMAGNGHMFTNLAKGVTFDLDASGKRVQTAWTSAGDDDVFVTLDVNKDGVVTGGAELLGNRWQTSDGKRVETALDSLVLVQGLPLARTPPLPKGISTIDVSDSVYAQLLAWNDVNQNGRSEASELRKLSDVGIQRILLGMGVLPGTPDANGNRLLADGSFYISERGIQVLRHMSLVQFAK